MIADRAAVARLLLLTIGVVSGCGGSAATSSSTTPSSSVPVATATPAATSSPAASPVTGDGTPSSVTDQSVGMPRSHLDLAHLPLGSQHFSVTAPSAGNLYLCHAMQGGPPVHNKPWVDTSSSTWNLTTKVAVAGDVQHDAQFSAAHVGDRQVLTGNGLPRHSGVFPVAASDPAHAYDPNPGSINAAALNVSLPFDPAAAAAPACIGGDVGVMSDGIRIFNGFDAGGNDAVAMEVQDRCHGHPNNSGYHYHELSPCLLSTAALTTTTQVGWAYDGYGLFVEYAADGTLLSNADLDACHGRTSVVPWHGQLVSIYHYVMTLEFPYSVACYHGTAVRTGPPSGPGSGPPGGYPGPP